MVSLLCLVVCAAVSSGTPVLRDGAYHVHPGQDIQVALELAATDASNKVVRVHAGTYRPQQKAQALIKFNARHDGIVLEAVGDVVLTAANEQIADRTAESFPAVVNHVVYFGDGVSSSTVLRGFRITGGNNFVTDAESSEPLEPHFQELRKTEGVYKNIFFYTDGAGIKIFGRSYPTLSGLEVFDNYASPCAGGVSIENRGFTQGTVQIRDCIFRGNRCLITGSAVDLLPGSSAAITNCLFVGNISNQGTTYQQAKGNIDWPIIPKLMANAVWYQREHGSGALTVFPGSRAVVDRCTFTGNFNGADDKGPSSVFRSSIFWNNTAPGGVRKGGRYELDILNATGVTNCFIGGGINDLRGKIDRRLNVLQCPDPAFDAEYVPRNKKFFEVGYRPQP